MPNLRSTRVPQIDDGANWFHVVLTTYGAWLPGDDRGFRTRHHRLHVDGDYKYPPKPGKFQGLKKSAQASLKHDAVSLTVPQRQAVGEAVREKATVCGAEIACIAVAATHTHLLIGSDANLTRKTAGAIKRHTWFTLRNEGWNRKLWAKGGKYVPVETRSHWDNVFAYILRHESEGAYVWRWDFTDPQKNFEHEDGVADVPPDATGPFPPGATGGL